MALICLCSIAFPVIEKSIITKKFVWCNADMCKCSVKYGKYKTIECSADKMTMRLWVTWAACVLLLSYYRMSKHISTINYSKYSFSGFVSGCEIQQYDTFLNPENDACDFAHENFWTYTVPATWWASLHSKTNWIMNLTVVVTFCSLQHFKCNLRKTAFHHTIFSSVIRGCDTV